MLNVYLRCLHELIVEKENCENAVVCIIVLGTIYVLKRTKSCIVKHMQRPIRRTEAECCS